MDSFFVKPGGTKRSRISSSGRSNGFPNGKSAHRTPRGNGARSREMSRGGRRLRGRGERGSSISMVPAKRASDNTASSQKKRLRAENEEIPSDTEDDDTDDKITLQPLEDDLEEVETEQEKRLRLTKDYLRQLEEQQDDKDVGTKLREEVLDAAGRLHRLVAQDLVCPDSGGIAVLKGHSGHKLSVTCITTDGKIIFSGGKEGTLIKWDVESRKLLKKVPLDKTEAVGHSGTISALCLSSDGKYLASGSVDKSIKIWLVDTFDLFHTFRGHRDIVSGVVFRMNTHQLYSCGCDRNVKVWNAAEKAYVETLFGHQNAVTGIDSFHKERCITSGGGDSSVRIWKILEESQLVFQLPSGSVECISLVDDEHFVTGNDDGSVALWGTHKKKPIYTIREAHKNANGIPCWVTAIDALKNTDLFVSGSSSGSIKVWRIQGEFQAILSHFDIAIVGFVNSLKVLNGGSLIVAGMGQEHRMGRWWRITEAKNSLCLIPLLKRTSVAGSVDTDVER